MKSAFRINFRVFAVVALSVTGTVFCAYLCAVIGVIGIVIGCVYCAVLAALAAVFSVKCARGRARLCVAAAFVLAFVLGTSAFAVATAEYYNKNEYVRSGAYTVTGRICAFDLRDGVYAVNLEDLRFDGRALPGILRAQFTANDDNIAESLDLGDKITFYSYVTASKLVQNGKVNGYAYRTNIRYSATVDGSRVVTEFGEPTLRERFMRGWRALYVKGMGERYGNIAYSMFTGDRYGLDDDISFDFSIVGIGHVLAVSGLHISFLAMLLEFLMSKVNRKVRFFVICAALFLYAFIADFSPSVVRALIMYIVSGIGMLLFKRRDLLSSWCCAYSLILAVRPFYMFEAGFLLSFGAILGIALFANSISRFFKAHGAVHKVSSGIGASVSVAVGVAPTQCYFFGTVNLLACIVNIVVIPYVTVVFVLLAVLTPVATIPHCYEVLAVCKYALMPLDYIVTGIARVNVTVIGLKCSSAVFMCYPLLFCASEYVMIKRGKGVLSVYAFLLCLLIFIISSL